MIMLKAFFVFFISGLDVRRVVSYYDDFFFFFFYHLLVCGQRFDHGPAVFLLWNTEGTMWEGIIFFLSQTVIIMQLVFECSFDTNVYHFKLVFLVFFTVW